MKHNKLTLLCLAGLLTALVFVTTAYLHIPTNNGYVHVGDGLIYLSACILPWPYAMAVGAGGAMLADCLTGYMIWAPGSVVIKAVTVLLFSRKQKKILTPHNLLMLFPAGIICMLGYYLYESLLYGNFIAPLTGIPASLIQSVASSVIFIIIGITLDKTNFKSSINGESL